MNISHRTLSPKPASTSAFSSFSELMAYLSSVGLFHMDLRLNRTQSALALLVPQPRMHMVQVLGTNGKGSTCTFLAALGRAHGLCTGLYTSPHFVSPRERIRINGQMLPEATWLELGNSIHAVAPTLTYFEFLTVLACYAFQQAGVELAIMEAGLGGRHDATTALPVSMLCYTPIAMDHETVLGDTLTEIATDKAAAIRHGMPAITGPQHPTALQCLQQAAASAGSPLIQVHEPLPTDIQIRMRGAHQADNARLALGTWRELLRTGCLGKTTSDHATMRHALQEAFIPGRLQYIPATDSAPALWLDGGHNPHGLYALNQALHHEQSRAGAIVFSCLADKNIDGMLPPLRELAGNSPIFVPTIADNPRACPGAELARRIGSQATATESLSAAFAKACQTVKGTPHPCVLVCGSLYLLGEFFTMHPDYLLAS
ncbi:MAG: bifunctional folylpolyglutamate synthase/dihydrofolate synthase [Desulfovibrionaceae bacterium]